MNEENKGFIKLDRSLLEWEWYDSISMRVLWLHILLSCNYKDKKWHGYEVPAGSFITSVSHLSEGTGLARNTVKKCLDRLIETGEITKEIRPSKHTQITVKNWSKYQAKDKSNAQSNSNHLSKGLSNTLNNSVSNTLSNTVATTKEIKKERNKEVKNTSTTEDRSKIIEALYYKTPEELERSRKVAEYLKRQEEKEKKC